MTLYNKGKNVLNKGSIMKLKLCRNTDRTAGLKHVNDQIGENVSQLLTKLKMDQCVHEDNSN